MKKIISILLALLVVAGLPQAAYADHLKGKDGWNVRYTGGGKMESNFRTADYNDPVAGLEPGDDITFTVSLKNENSAETDWYMTNEVLHSLEDRGQGAAGGAYSYTLRFKGPSGERLLYDSDTVGGELVAKAGEGLHQATSALENYFYLDTMKSGESGSVTLVVALDGETQGNGYQDKLADLQMNFAVEQKGTVVKTRGVQTGDDRMQLVPVYVAMLLGGAVLLYVTVRALRRYRRED